MDKRNRRDTPARNIKRQVLHTTECYRSSTRNKVVHLEMNDNSYAQPQTLLWPHLIFGDQLTSAHVQGAITLRCFHKTSLARLQGYVPVTSDWHARLCLVTVSLCMVCTV